jgi:hypothetical protein
VCVSEITVIISWPISWPPVLYHLHKSNFFPLLK